MIHDGTAVFEDNDVIVFEVEGATAEGVLTDDSVIVRIIVYDNAADYFNDVPKYTYDAPPGGGGDIEEGRNTMGDRYIEFDASDLTSTDPGAPVLDELAAVAGVNILDVLANQNGPFEVPTNEDIDLDGDGIIDPDEEADGSFSSDLNILTEQSLICFAAGTLIETPMGPQPIETLREGDMVNTLDAGPQRIRWIGGRTTCGLGRNAPVCIRRGTLGNVRDLWVSPNHRMVLRGARAELLFGESEVLVAAKHLVDGKAIRIVPVDEVDYWHFLLDGHQIVFAEACATESLYPGQQSLQAVTPDERDEIVALFPELEARRGDMHMSRYPLKNYEASAWRLSA
ncbi:MAG: Hint domain-containing protein [Rhodobacteraceae bacterium]|nr:Hint domain-containing protein [Paracoccaceae bacterium]